MTNEQLIIENSELKSQNNSFKKQITSLNNKLYALLKILDGKKSEKLKLSPEDINQLNLFIDLQASLETEKAKEEKSKTITVPAHKRKINKSGGRKPFSDDFERVEEIIRPDDYDPDTHIEIGRDETELLEYAPARLWVRKIIRPRYAIKGDEDAGISQVSIPPRLIAKGMVGDSLLAGMIDEKIQFHTPIYRFNKKLKQSGVDFLTNNQLYDWFHKAAEALLPLYHLIKKQILKQEYLQADETTFKVLKSPKKNGTQLGYMWLMYQPMIKLVYFQFDTGRGIPVFEGIIDGFKGFLQSDGYKVYASLAKRSSFTQICCMAHARRKFHDALETDPEMAKCFLKQVALLYKLEKKLRTDNASFEQRYKQRQEIAKPILNALGKWINDKTEDMTILPSSRIAKAINYSRKRWPELCGYIENGKLEIDNNLIENQVRPLALGRKNYLFAKNEQTANNIACLYSIVGSAKQYNLNVFKYLNFLLKKASSEKITDQAVNWLPHKLDKTNFELLKK